MSKKFLTIVVTLLTFLTVESALAQYNDSKCPQPKGWVINDLSAALASHKEWLSKRGKSDPTIPGRAIFCNADLTGADLSGTNLTYADLSGANLTGTNLTGAFLSDADLTQAILIGANLTGATLLNANLAWAEMFRTNLTDADLTSANLVSANLFQTILVDAKFSSARLSGAYYQPATAPAKGWLSGIEGLKTVRFCPLETSGLVQLRATLRAAGLRDLEREATYALGRGLTSHALLRWTGSKIANCGRYHTRDRWAAVDGVFRLVFFEWTTDYGLAYGRPILILIGLIGVFSAIYLLALITSPRRIDAGSIYRIWPEGRIERRGAKLIQSQEVIIERLKGHGFSALGYALYFSVISAFHLGWRDLNVGTWIARLQPREYALRAKGWVRVVSGIQSLVSVYLIAMWVLTYFGRPFE